MLFLMYLCVTLLILTSDSSQNSLSESSCTLDNQKHRKIDLATKHTIKLPILRSPWDSIVEQVRLLKPPNFTCNFNVTTPARNQGIIIAAKNFELRKDELIEECIDYMQFVQPNGSMSQKYCGIYTFHRDFSDKMNLPINKYYSGIWLVPHNFLEMKIFVSTKNKGYERHPQELYLFPYQTCDRSLRHLLQCGATQQVCVYDDFGDICPLPPCVDDNYCVSMDLSPSIGQRVIIGSLSTLFMIFLVFIVFLWYARTYNLFCWAPTFANRNQTPVPTQETSSDQPLARVLEMSEREARTTSSQRNEPSLGEPVKEDMPPSYDSLFPRR